jgi:hypothetical protein
MQASELALVSGAAPLVLELLAAHAGSERVASFAAAALGQLYEAAAEAARSDSAERLLARSLLRFERSVSVVNNAQGALESSGCSSKRLAALLRAEGASEAQVLALRRGYRDSCASCGLRGEALKFCTACFEATYCGRACQRDDWPRHKVACGAKKGAASARS